MSVSLRVAEFLYNREFRGFSWEKCSGVRRKYYLSFADELIALIGKCATPTFSGKVIDKTKSVGCNTCEYEERICITPCTYKKKPTEQKEYCKCPTPIHEGDKCMDCGKPIPAEKK